MLPERIFLVDRGPGLVAAWREVFRDHPEITAEIGDYFAFRADAMVSPANSFGIMDGGLDAAIVNVLGAQIALTVREMIVAKHHGELHVGSAEIIETHDTRWPHLVVAPTMRVPDNVSKTTNAYLSFRAILLAVKRFNEMNSVSPIKTLLCSGLATGVGAMPARRCAAQMRIAYRQIKNPPSLQTFDEIYDAHTAMRTVT